MAYDPTVLGANAKINPYDNTSSIVLPSLTSIINYLIGNPPPAPVVPPFAGTILTNYVGNMTLANDVGTITTVLDIAAGVCADSTNTSYITLPAFTKSIGGLWVAGSGNNGLGVTLPGTGTFPWLHVFAIMNNGVADVYFDTDVGAANKPAGTTAFRRIGSKQLDTNNHWILFTQTGNVTLLTTAAGNGGLLTGATAQLFGLSTPANVKVMALMRVGVANASANIEVLLTSPDEGDNSPDGTSGYMTAKTTAANVRAPGGHVQVMTSAGNPASIRARASVGSTNTNVGLSVYGWIDYLVS